ncbi:hypothetical protein DSO57_1003632 [Entomophthora muscae]|uniref:Uncharacterized protein n=1 Tax=Entomophthora muscae TaxID=34485 RepID=A0ACC2SLC0_9FUNG|nr:hypothetical protein DSO57_1003632 [Entomophthora muscae]
MKNRNQVVRNDISAPLKPQDLEQVLNPVQDCLWAASPEDQGADCPCFFGNESSLIQIANALEDRAAIKDLPIMAPIKEHKKLPNEGKEVSAIGLMSLMPTLGINHNPATKENLG